jgi:uncharacterized protein YndB with AHSA1/START domain
MGSGWFKPSTVYAIYIAATPDQVWRALTTAEFSRQHFFGFAIEIDLKVGGELAVLAPDGALHISGEVIECELPRRLSLTWNVNWDRLVEQLGATLVTYQIEPAGDTVRLTLTEAHEKQLSDDILSGGLQGWPAILLSLKSLLETERTLAVQMAPPHRMLAALKQLGIAVPGGPAS